MSFKKFLRKAIPVALVVLPFVAPALVTSVGTALTGQGASAAMVKAVGTAAISGGATLAMGGTPEQALKAAAGGFVGSQVSSALPADVPRPVAAGLGQTAASLTSGQSLNEAARAGLVSGITSAVFPAPSANAPVGEAVLSGLGKAAFSTSLSKLLAPKTPSTVSGGAGASTAQGPTSVTTTGAGTAPGSSALAQALRTDMGAPIFGGEKEKGGARSGWNVESLRYMGNSGEA